MPFVIHVGTHKTGTTSLQRFAGSNRKELKKRGIWYPSYAEIGLTDTHYGHHQIALALAGQERANLSESAARQFVEYIDRKRNPGETVLISAEPFYRLTMGMDQKTHRWRSSSASYWGARVEYIAKMRETFPFDDVEILICLRRQDSFARSVYQERVKVTKFNDTFPAFLHKDRAIFDYLGQVEAFAQHFPKIRVVTFEGLLEKGDLHSSFFGLFGADISFAKTPPVANVSLPLEFVEFKRLLNKTSISREDADRIGKELLNMAQGDVLRPARNLDWLPFEDMAGFLGSFERDNERLRRLFAASLPAPLFPPPEQTGKKTFARLNPYRAMQIAQLFMKS